MSTEPDSPALEPQDPASDSENSAPPATAKKPRVYLIDGYSNIFRAFYAIRDLSSSRGEPTNAVFGFLQILRKLLRDEQPEYLGIAMDVSSRTIRKEKYEDYKANRRPMPDELRSQIPWIRKVAEAYGIPLLEMEKYEADDVLGTLAARGSAEGYEVYLVSPDKDLMQLVGDGVFLQHTGRDKLYDAAAVEEDFGVAPDRVIDVLALQGDASDNVPGVPGIGEKGARKLIAEHGSLEDLLDNASQVKRKPYREGLMNHRDQALLSKELVTIHRDLPIEFDPESLRQSEPDWPALLDLCWRLDFQGVARDIEAHHGAAARPLQPAGELTSADEVAERLAGAGERVTAAVISEPSGAVLGLAVGLPAEEDALEGLWIDFRREGLREASLEWLRTFVAADGATLAGHDLKEVLRLLGPRAEIRCRLLDTMLLSYIVRSALRAHDLGTVVMDRLHRSLTSPKDAGLSKDELPMLGADALRAFVAERVMLPHSMAEGLEQEMDSQDLRPVYETIEEPLVPVLATIEETGVLVDREFLAQMSGELAGEIEATEADIYERAGETFNIQSPKQLGEILFVKLDYPVLRKTRKTRSYSTDAETLEELAARGYDLPERIIHYRELTKLKSTYVDALPTMVAEDGRIHTRFNQAVAATGRLSSAQPNLQNIPIRTELGQRIRKAFRAAPGHRLVVADYSQVELRVLAHVAEESVMIDAFSRGEDIHAATAAAVFGGSPLLINPDQRRMAKVINFGIVYGMTAFGLGRQLGLDRKDAQKFIDTYMDRYPGVRRYTEETLDEAFENGCVRTLYGRVRQLPDIRSRNWNLRENAKRMAINAPIQGTAADLLKLAMIAVEERLEREKPEAKLLLTVHDELVIEAPEAEAEEVAEILRDEMMGVAELKVPLVVDAGIGESWYDAKD
ncbi:MAG: DNA polymerase I [Acidobacteriota bacterium]